MIPKSGYRFSEEIMRKESNSTALIQRSWMRA
jgi:hypothetical protein